MATEVSIDEGEWTAGEDDEGVLILACLQDDVQNSGIRFDRKHSNYKELTVGCASANCSLGWRMRLRDSGRGRSRSQREHRIQVPAHPSWAAGPVNIVLSALCKSVV